MKEHPPYHSQDNELPPDQSLRILCVDDEADILMALTRLFRREPYEVLTATSGEDGLAILKNTQNIGLIISDYRMPTMSGSDFLKAAAALAPDSYRMILTGYADLNAAIDVMNQGSASRFVTKPADNDELRQTVRDGLSLYQKTLENRRLAALVKVQNEELAEWNSNLKKRVLQQTAQLRKQIEKQSELQQFHTADVCNALVSTFTDLLEYRNPGLAAHSRRVAMLATQIAHKQGLSDQSCEDIRVAALIHDIGTLGLPDKILIKSEQYMTPVELEEYRSHSIKGELAVEKIELLREVSTLIRHHHENYDGSGYPDGLAGDQIPLGSRIIALASWIEDAYSNKNSPFANDPLTQRLDWEMEILFDPALATAANEAIALLLDPTAG